MAKRNGKIGYAFDPYRREVIRALCQTKLSGADFRVLLTILGQTDGYHRSEDKIKPDLFQERTGLDKANIRRTISRLRSWGIISRTSFYFTVNTPDSWKQEVFLETQNRFNFDTVLGEQHDEKRIKSDTLSVNEDDENRIKSDTPTASNLIRSEDKIDTVLASSKEHYLKNTTKESTSSSKNDDVKEIYEKLKDRRGYNSPVAGAEAKAMNWMLGQGYNVADIISCYDLMKEEPFWSDKFLNMQTVRSQIGEKLKKEKSSGTNRQVTRRSTRALPRSYTRPEDLRPQGT